MSADNGPANDDWADHQSPSPTFTQLRRDPLVGHAAFR
jgi:hypothetical protein